MRLLNRVERSEREAGCAGGVCAMCERRAEAEREAPRTFGPEWEEMPLMSATVNCPGCGRPFVLEVVGIGRKEAA